MSGQGTGAGMNLKYVGAGVVLSLFPLIVHLIGGGWIAIALAVVGVVITFFVFGAVNRPVDDLYNSLTDALERNRLSELAGGAEQDAVGAVRG